MDATFNVWFLIGAALGFFMQWWKPALQEQKMPVIL